MSSDLINEIFSQQPTLSDGFPTSTILASLRAAKSATNEQIRELVIKQRRFDILAKYVLGYDPQDFHLEMMQWQDETDEGLSRPYC